VIIDPARFVTTVKAVMVRLILEAVIDVSLLMDDADLFELSVIHPVGLLLMDDQLG
jgi:hypothetical protein